MMTLRYGFFASGLFVIGKYTSLEPRSPIRMLPRPPDGTIATTR